MHKIYLVRHGLSESNLDVSVNKRKPDHAIELDRRGHLQAVEAGKLLIADILATHAAEARETPLRVRFVVSPYVRTRQTAAGLMKAFDKQGVVYEQREVGELREQSFGLFDGLSDDELKDQYPKEHAHYQKHTSFEGEYFATMPMGESRALVADRVRGAFGTILRNMECENPVTHTIVVSHGVTLRCFRQAWFYRDWQWVEAEPNPNNCSIMVIEGTRGQWDERLLSDGFAPMHREQDQREEGHI